MASLPSALINEPRILGPQDTAILQAFADGESSDNVALMCNWARGTLKNRLKLIYIMLGADNRTHAIAQAMRRKIIS